MAGGFDALGLMPELLRAVDEMSWYLPTDVQDEAIPLLLGGGDVMVAAETGSGKTGAFALPVAQVVHEIIRNETSEKEPARESNSTKEFKIDEMDKDGLLRLSADHLSGSVEGSKNWVGARATFGAKSGKHYYEATVTGDGICRFGWSTKAGHLELGRDAHGFGYGGTAKKSHGNAFSDYGRPYGAGAVVGCLLDLEGMSIAYCLDGEPLETAFSLDAKFKGSVFFPAFCIKNSGFTINFGGSAESPLRFAPPAGFSPLATASPAQVVPSKSKKSFATGCRTPRAVILEPARDLAEQVYNNIIDITRHLSSPSLKTMLVVGGEQKKQNFSAGMDILVGTPLRISDLVKRGEIDFSQVRLFILDEADRLLETGNLDTVMRLYSACPAGGVGGNRMQVSFFSATLHSPEIQELGNKLCHFPTWVDLKGKDSVPEFVHHTVYRLNVAEQRVEGTSKMAGTTALLRNVQTFTDNVHVSVQGSSDPGCAKVVDPEATSQAIKEAKQKILLEIVDKFEMSQCLIFCRTNLDCNNLETFLCAADSTVSSKATFKERKETGKESRYSCCVLAGMRSMEQRRRALEAFKEGDVRFLVCTDVAARGIDIQSLPYVINMTLPDESEHYIHRIGRVGRAGKMGLAISIVSGPDMKEKVWYHTCGNKGGVGCMNRKLKERGGCTIWYNEPELLKNIESRLGKEIPELTSDFNLPDCLACSGVVYGETANQEDSDPLAKKHLEELKPMVKELAEIEMEAQNLFLGYGGKYGCTKVAAVPNSGRKNKKK